MNLNNFKYVFCSLISIFFIFTSALPQGKKDLEEIKKQFLEEIQVMVYKVKPIPLFKDTIPILGTITPLETVNLKFSERGIVKKIYFKEGDQVKEGDLLAELEETEFILRRDYAKNKYESENSLLLSMEKEFQVKKALYDKGAILKEKIEEMKLRIDSQRFRTESAKKEWELAEDSIKKIKLTSPCNGKIDKKDISEGELVSPEIKAFTIIKIDKVYAEVGVTEKDISRIKQGQIAQIWVETYPEIKFTGLIKNILPSVKGTSRTLTLRIEIDNTDNNYTLLPGMFLKGEIIINEFKNALIVPTENLLVAAPEIYAVYVLEPDNEFTDKDLEEGKVIGTIELKQIEVLHRSPEYSVIAGLENNSLIITRSEGEILPYGKGKVVGVETFESRE
ncbi:MAG: efflux RND transporter periplasmic adaptor subunit [Candidatus Omnitrophica bacterium]|nr:efflux RND transporter periplasmic adaptor subunit [Candidatus Omnitrophota bacterium]